MPENGCYPLKTLHMLGKRHTAVLLEEIDARRYLGFNHTVRQIGVTPKVLAERLTELEGAELVVKSGDTYEITPKGKELVLLFRAIKTFHLKYGETSPECTDQLCTECRTLNQKAGKMESPSLFVKGNENLRLQNHLK